MDAETRDRMLYALGVIETRHPGKPPHTNKDHGRKGIGSSIRNSLLDAETLEEVSAVLAAEAEAITGRPLRVNMVGSDVHVARQHAEGILTGFEHFPNTPIDSVHTYGPGTSYSGQFSLGNEDAMAISRPGATSHAIGFNTVYAGDPDLYKRHLKESVDSGHFPPPRTPVGIAMHEFGHALADRANANGVVLARARELATAEGSTVKTFVGDRIGVYATSDEFELSAEAFTDVMVSGTSAADLSHELFALIEESYEGALA